MSVEFYRGSPGNFDSRTLNRETLDRWTGRNPDFLGCSTTQCFFERLVRAEFCFVCCFNR